MQESHERAQEKCLPPPHCDSLIFAKGTSHPHPFAIAVCHAKQRHAVNLRTIYAVNSRTILPIVMNTHAIKTLLLRTRARTLLLTKHALEVLTQVCVFERCSSNELTLYFCSLDPSFEINPAVHRLRRCRCIVIQLHDMNVFVGKELGNLRRPVVRFATVIY